jgi:hypothetical protein
MDFASASSLSSQTLSGTLLSLFVQATLTLYTTAVNIFTTSRNFKTLCILQVRYLHTICITISLHIFQEDRQFTYKITFQRVLATIIAVEKQ